MKGPGRPLDPVLKAFLKRPFLRPPGMRPAKRPPAPAAIRGRALARAKATFAAEMVPASPETRPAPVGVSARAWHGARFRMAFAAAIMLVVGAAAASAALRNHWWNPGGSAEKASRPVSVHPAAPGRETSQGAAPATPAETAQASASSRVPAFAPAPPTVRPKVERSRGAVPGNAPAAELDLVGRAYSAFDRRDFSAALALVAEHARRFPEGRLAEQREALRVKSLSATGRTREAHAAAVAFAAKFPRSVLLGRLAEP